MNAILTSVFLRALPLLLAVPAHLAGSAPIEVVELPASEAYAAASMEQRLRPLTLSEQYSTTRIGSLQSGGTEDFPVSGKAPATVYECRALITDAPGGADRAAIVVELARQRAYLMIDGVMVLETPVSLGGKGDAVPLGWLPVSGRTRGAALSPEGGAKPSYFLKLGSTAFGLHSDDISGYSGAAGCIRFPRPAMKTVFDHIVDGTMVYICSVWLGPVRVSPAPMAATPPPAPAPARPETAALPLPEPPGVTAPSPTPPKAPVAGTSAPASTVAATPPPRHQRPVTITLPPPVHETVALEGPLENASVEATAQTDAYVSAGPAAPVSAVGPVAPPARTAPQFDPEPEPATAIAGQPAMPPRSRPTAPDPVRQDKTPPLQGAPGMDPDPAELSIKTGDGQKVVRVRDLLGGFGEKSGTIGRALIPVTGRTFRKPEPAAPVEAEPAAPVEAEPAAPVEAEPAAPVPPEPKENPEIIRFRTWIRGR